MAKAHVKDCVLPIFNERSFEISKRFRTRWYAEGAD